MALNHRLHSKLRRKHLFFGLFLRQLIFALLAFIRSELLYPKKVEQAKNGIYHKRVTQVISVAKGSSSAHSSLNSTASGSKYSNSAK